MLRTFRFECPGGSSQPGAKVLIEQWEEDDSQYTSLNIPSDSLCVLDDDDIEDEVPLRARQGGTRESTLLSRMMKIIPFKTEEEDVTPLTPSAKLYFDDRNYVYYKVRLIYIFIWILCSRFILVAGRGQFLAYSI